eukprot:654361-Pleurochrysis_carterae.AAC.2
MVCSPPPTKCSDQKPASHPNMNLDSDSDDVDSEDKHLLKPLSNPMNTQPVFRPFGYIERTLMSIKQLEVRLCQT